MSQPRSLLILYGSQSGNSEDIAVQAGKASKEFGLNPTVSSMDEIKCRIMGLSEDEALNG